MEFDSVSPAIEPELLSMLLPQVKDPWICTPWLIFFTTPTWSAWYDELPPQSTNRIAPAPGLTEALFTGLACVPVGRKPTTQGLPFPSGPQGHRLAAVGRTILPSSMRNSWCTPCEPT